jgi:hypothetical protein
MPESHLDKDNSGECAFDLGHRVDAYYPGLLKLPSALNGFTRRFRSRR